MMNLTTAAATFACVLAVAALVLGETSANIHNEHLASMASATLGNMDGTVFLGLDDLDHLRQKADEREAEDGGPLPEGLRKNWHISNLDIFSPRPVGPADSFVTLEYKIDVTVLKDAWALVRLFPMDTIVESVVVSDAKTGQEISPPAPLTIWNRNLSVGLSRKGTYVITAEVTVPRATQRSISTLGIPRPRAFSTRLTIGLPPSAGGLTSVPHAELVVKRPEGPEGTAWLEAAFPPAEDIQLQWRDGWTVDGPDGDDGDESENQVVSEQNTIFAVGEGLLTATTEFAVTSQAPLSSVEIEISDPNLRIVSVDAAGGLVRSWEEVPCTLTETGGPAATATNAGKRATQARMAADGCKVLRVLLSAAAVPTQQPTDDYRFIVFSELAVRDDGGRPDHAANTDAPTRTEEFFLPTFAVRGTYRDQGYFGVVARTNVEVSEVDTEGATRVDTSELPDSMRHLAAFPILSAYKHLTPDHDTRLRVERHDDVGVLQAVIESAQFEVTTSESKAMATIKAVVRNTHKQFLRVFLPAEATVYTSFVGGVAVKPVRDGNATLVPLTASMGSDSEFEVEITYFLVHDGIDLDATGGGRWEVAFPRLDIPITYAQASIFFPSELEVDGSGGDMTARQSFSKSIGFSTGGGRAAKHGGRGLDESTFVLSGVTASQAAYSMEDWREEYGRMNVRNVVAEGTAPVGVTNPRTGNQVRFEKLFVVGEEMTLFVDYHAPSSLPGWLHTLVSVCGLD